MAIKVYSEKDLRNQELLIGNAESANSQSVANKNLLDAQWFENRAGFENNFFIQDDSGANLWLPDFLLAGSWYSLGKLVLLDVSFTFPNNSDTQVSILGIGGAGIPPPIPMQDFGSTDHNIVSINGTTYSMHMNDQLTSIAIWFDGQSFSNQDLSDALIKFKVFYKAQ